MEYAKIESVQRCLDFNFYDAFRVVYLGGRGYFTEKKLYEAFQAGARHLVDDDVTGIDLPEVTSHEITMFFIRYDKDRYGLLSLQ